jgi:RNA polymerase-associated protein
MAVIANRRSVMTLFSRPTDIHSHRTRLVLAEKNINIEISNVAGPDLPEDLMDLNPYHSVPTLVDRDLTLYDSRVIIEYLDERFPHPPLMPVDPVTRAQFRLRLIPVSMASLVLKHANCCEKAFCRARNFLVRGHTFSARNSR